MNPVDIKIAYIGGGSRDWARKLMVDLALCAELSGQMTLYDIDQDSAHLNERLGNWLQGQPDVVSHWRYTTCETLTETLRGADFVIISIQPGSLEVMAEEIAIAEEYGLFFPVGDTTGAPGLVRGLRSAMIYSDFAETISMVCPAAWVINYTNPMTICTRTLTRVAPELKVLGACHEVFATQRMLAGLAVQYLDVSPAPARDEIRVNVFGINHFTWIDQASYQGHDLLQLLHQHITRPGTLRTYTREEVVGWNNWFLSTDQVKFSLFQRFGILAAAGDRHLVEFLPGFIRSPQILFRWGIIRTPVAWRIERRQAAPQHARSLMSGRVPFELTASEEAGVGQLKSLVGLGEMQTNVNMENQGQVANLPMHAVVETNAYFSRDEVRPLAAGPLPPALLPWVARHSANQELIITAALEHDKELAFQAVYGDPTNHLPLDDSWEMFTRLLQAGRPYLEGWTI